MAPFAASLARVHPFLTPCSGAHCFPQTDQIVQSQTGTRSPIARAIAAPERQVVQLPNVQPSRDYKQSDQVPGRLMRICTLTEDPAGAEATSSGRKDLPVGTWEEGLAADTWKRHLLYPRSFYEQFIVHITRSSDAIYGEGKGPFSLDMKNDPSQLRPDLGPAGQDMWEADGGLSDLLGFVTSFPMTKDACKTIGEFWLPFFALDDYVEHHSLEEAEDVAEWYKALWRMSESGDYSQAVSAIPACFVAEPKLFKLAALYCSSVEAYHSRAAAVDPAWARFYGYTIYLYAAVTLEEIRRNAAYNNSGKLPTLAEYLRYRCLLIGVIPILAMTAVERGICLSPERFARAVPLFVNTTILGALVNDILAAAKDSANGVTNVVAIVGQEQAAHVHNVLMDCLCEEIDRFMADAKPGDHSQECSNAVRATVFGDFMFMNTCSRYRRFVEQTRQPVAVADCPEGRLTDTRSPLYREMRELVASISRDVAEGFSLEAGAARSRT